MAELHQLLAVESDLKAEAQSKMNDVRAKFEAGGPFLGQTRRYAPLEDGGEPLPSEDKELASRVSGELDIALGAMVKWMDAALQKESTNQTTSADVQVGKKLLATNVPAPALLNLESKLAEVKALLQVVPTNDPAERWEFDETLDCYVSAPRETYRTKKVFRNHIKAEPTKEHPAQVEVFAEDVRIGDWTTTIFSGMIPVSDKREMLERVDEVIRAVKDARQRANTAEIVDRHDAQAFIDYIISG